MIHEYMTGRASSHKLPTSINTPTHEYSSHTIAQIDLRVVSAAA
jgi:hypothetical protein